MPLKIVPKITKRTPKGTILGQDGAQDRQEDPKGDFLAKTLIFLWFFKVRSQQHRFSLGFLKVKAKIVQKQCFFYNKNEPHGILTRCPEFATRNAIGCAEHTPGSPCRAAG